MDGAERLGPKRGGEFGDGFDIVEVVLVDDASDEPRDSGVAQAFDPREQPPVERVVAATDGVVDLRRRAVDGELDAGRGVS